jgi:hypothetical protein
VKRLKNLNPKWLGLQRPSIGGVESGEGLAFDCPVCPPEKGHRLAAFFENPIDGEPPAPWLGKSPTNPVWKRSGDSFGTLSIAPSLNYPCFHGWVECGRVIDIKEAPIVVFGMTAPGQHGPVALSPLQAIEGCRAVIMRAQVMLGDQSVPEHPPARVMINPDDVELWVGETKILVQPRGNEARMMEMMTEVNVYFGHIPERKPPSLVLVHGEDAP